MAEHLKHCRVEWIKNIPEGWQINKVKYLATKPNTLFIDGDWIESDVIEESGIRYLTTGNIGAGFYKEQGNGYISEKTFKELHCLEVFTGDLIISRLNEPIGRACIVPEGEDRYVVAVDNVILRLNRNYCKKFFMYVMNTDGYAEHANMVARGATMSRISRGQLGQFWVPVPVSKEQQAIADLLDEQCAKIDNITTDIEKQIEVLKKYKKALITETVTKGLDKYVQMNESGIEWIGKIPNKFEIMKLKHLFSMYAGGDVDEYNFSDEQTGKYEYPIYSNSLENNGLFGYMSKYRFYGETITVTGRGDVGKAIARKNAFYPVVRLLVCVPKRIVDVRYFTHCINSADIFGDQTAMAQLTTQRLGAVEVPVPKYNEQRIIADYLDTKCEKIDSVIESKEKQLELVKQYKKSLIYEYVTGKKRVAEVKN